MRALIAFLLCALLLAPYTAEAQTGLGSDCTITAADQPLAAIDIEALNLVNTYRTENHLSPVALVPSLQRAATWHSRDMATNRYVSHTDLFGRGPGTRMTDCGDSDPYQWRGEIIGAGYQTAAQMVTAWKNSPGHNAAMLDPKYVSAGIKRIDDGGVQPYYYRWFWTMTFASTMGGEQPISIGPAPTPTGTPSFPLPTTGPRNTATSPPLQSPTPTPYLSRTPTRTVTPSRTATPAGRATATRIPTRPPLPTATLKPPLWWLTRQPTWGPSPTPSDTHA